MPPLALPAPLVTTSWLAQHLHDRGVKVVDASSWLPTAGRDARAEYESAHIPSAVFADIDRLSDERSPLPHTLLDPTRFGERIGELGISNDDFVVVYDSSGQNFSAPRLWWMLRAFGHDRVAVLDGGLRRWTLDGHAVDRGRVGVAPAHFEARLDASRVRDLAAMRANLESREKGEGGEQMVDARSPGRFAATEPEPRPGVRGGHIPGSRSLHYASLVRDDGTMRPPEELRALATESGLDLSRPIVASCGSGVTACAVVLALDSLGVRAAVYDGSWSEWGGRSDTPVETGAPPKLPPRGDPGS